MTARGPKPAGLFNKRGRAVAALASRKVAGCVECGKTALCRVGSRGYCKAHRDDAMRRQKVKTYHDDYSARLRGTSGWGEE